MSRFPCFSMRGRFGSDRMENNLKSLTLLHSNDLHGEFLAKETDGRFSGGMSMLSGYLNRVRREEKNVLYAISGDMLRGSPIDSEYKGISTIEITNLLAPDVATIGNHEVDYGVAHLLLLEKCARFPIINANMYLTNHNVRLFQPYRILKIDGVKILFIGVLTQATLAQTRRDELIGDLIDVKDALTEIGKICDSFRTEDIDCTVLLTHIGIEEDKKLAEALDPCWGVDLIIGGHSHTRLTEPVVVNGIPIVQAAAGTGVIGRFDIVVDREKNCIHSYKWNLISINEDTSPRDTALERVIDEYREVTDRKYGRIVTRFTDVYTHPVRNRETQLGRLFSDIYRESLGVDIMFLASGGIRSREMGPIVDYKALMAAFCFDEPLYRVTFTGAQLRRALQWMLREEAFTGHTEFYQLSQGIRAEYSRRQKKILKMEFQGMPVQDNQLLNIALHEFHYQNMDTFLHVTREEADHNRPSRKIAASSCAVLDEHMTRRELYTAPEDERIIILP